MRPEPTFSVLMPVHAGVAAEHLRRALESVAAQTAPIHELVLVEDGPLPSELRQVIDTHPGHVVRVVLPVNSGPGVANQAGLVRCTGEWVVKADADDISLPCRVARLSELARTTGADLCGSAMLEFVGDEDDVRSIRRVPTSHSSIARRMRLNNPFNHPAVMYRRALAVDVGGYPDLRFGEDYDLFARMLSSGARTANTDEALVLFRTGRDFVARRRTSVGAAEEWRLQRNLHSYGLIGGPRMIVNFILRMSFRWGPAPVASGFLRHVLSRRPGTGP
jgi:glycosyltransferase involved in cell wall biosynthesis